MGLIEAEFVENCARRRQGGIRGFSPRSMLRPGFCTFLAAFLSSDIPSKGLENNTSKEIILTGFGKAIAYCTSAI